MLHLSTCVTETDKVLHLTKCHSFRFLVDRVLLIGGKARLGYGLPGPPRVVDDRSMPKEYLREVSSSRTGLKIFILDMEAKLVENQCKANEAIWITAQRENKP